MPNYQMSERWEKSSEFKAPFNYAVGTGKLTDEEAEAYEGKGQLCQVRRVDMGDLIKLGIAEELDFMSKSLIAPDEPAKGEESATDAIKSAIMKADNYSQMERMVNLVCEAGILQPRLYAPPTITKTENGKSETQLRKSEGWNPRGRFDPRRVRSSR